MKAGKFVTQRNIIKLTKVKRQFEDSYCTGRGQLENIQKTVRRTLKTLKDNKRT